MPGPDNCLTERDHLTIELALIIEDPAGIEQIDLAAVIVEVFERRSARQCELMRQSLWRWAQQWPRTLSAVEAAEPPPPTERNVCRSCNGSGMVTKYIRPGVTGAVPCLACRAKRPVCNACANTGTVTTNANGEIQCPVCMGRSKA